MVEYSLTSDMVEEIHVYALDKMLNVKQEFLLNELYHAMDAHIYLF